MKNIAENNMIRFINITKKKDGLFANFKVKGIRGGVSFSASIAVDVASVEIDISEDNLEKIIEQCSRVAVKEFKKAEFQFEGLQGI